MRHALKEAVYEEEDAPHSNVYSLESRRHRTERESNLFDAWEASLERHYNEILSSYEDVSRILLQTSAPPSWLPPLKTELERSLTGSDREYSIAIVDELAKQGSGRPRFEISPEGGAVLTFDRPHGAVTIIVENEIGMIVRTAPDFVANANFSLAQSSKDSFLRRSVLELHELDQVSE